MNGDKRGVLACRFVRLILLKDKHETLPERNFSQT